MAEVIPIEIPTIRVAGIVGADFSGVSLAAFIEEANARAGAAKIILDSVGGDPAEAFHVYDFVRANGLKLFVDIYGRCASAATIIAAAAGRKRTRIAPNAEFLIHEASGASADELEDVNARMAKVYSELTGMGAKEVRGIMKENMLRNAEWAVDNGFAGAEIELQKLAAQVVTKTEMSSETKTVKVKLVDFIRGSKDVEFDVEQTVADQLAANATDLKDNANKIAELESEIAKLKGEGDVAEKAKADAEAAKVAQDAKVVEGEVVIAQLKKDIEATTKKLEAAMKVPAVAQLLATTDDVLVDPAAAPVPVTPAAKAEERRSEISKIVNQTLDKQRKK